MKRMIAAHTSPKRFIRHNLGLKAPRGWGWLTNPKRAAHSENTVNMLKNFFAAMPVDTVQEAFDDLLNVLGLRIERIVSHGQKSPPDFWYEQDDDEWVMILQGTATLQIEGHETAVMLTPGDHYWIPAGLRHRVDSTALEGPTIWLAVHR